MRCEAMRVSEFDVSVHHSIATGEKRAHKLGPGRHVAATEHNHAVATRMSVHIMYAGNSQSWKFAR